MSAPFMQLYVADYLGDTRHLTTEQHGAYLLLLMTMWRSEGRLPNDDKKLARLAGCTSSRWAKIRAEVMEFFTVEGEEITNARLKFELEKASEKSIKRAEAGTRGGRAKALKSNKPDLANATGLLCHSSEPEPEEPPVVPPRGTKPPKVTKDQVQAIWSACPAVARQRSSVADVEAALNAALRRGHHPEPVLAGLLAAYRSESYSGDKAKGIHRLIEKDRWASFVEALSAHAAPTAPPVYDGPPELRAWVAQRHGETYAASYIDRARWDGAARVLLAANAFAVGKLRTDLAPICRDWKFTVELAATNDNANQERAA